MDQVDDGVGRRIQGLGFIQRGLGFQQLGLVNLSLSSLVGLLILQRDALANSRRKLGRQVLFQAAVLVLLTAAARAGIVATGFWHSGSHLSRLGERTATASPPRHWRRPPPCSLARRILRKRPFWRRLFRPQEETNPVCHALLQDPKFLTLLLRVDHEFAAQRRADGCRCGGNLHCADYPRKPRGIPASLRPDHSLRLSLCCAVCRTRSTPLSVRFLGRRVYLALAVVLVSASRTASTPTGARLGAELGVARQTLQRWQAWWTEQFPLTPLWRATCARFMPPADIAGFPGTLIERFLGSPADSLMRLLVFLSPVTLRGGEPAAFEVCEGR